MDKFIRRGASLMVYGLRFALAKGKLCLWFMVFLLFTIFYLPSTSFAQGTDIGQSRIHPASPLYFLKTIRESLEMHFAPTQRVKRIRQLEFATRRLREVKALVSVKREDLIQATLERYWSHISFLPDKDLGDQELVSLIGGTIEKHVDVLEQTYSQIQDPTAKMGIRTAMNKLSQRADLFPQTRVSICNFLSKEASSSALNEVEKEILSQRAQKCYSVL